MSVDSISQGAVTYLMCILLCYIDYFTCKALRLCLSLSLSIAMHSFGYPSTWPYKPRAIQAQGYTSPGPYKPMVIQAHGLPSPGAYKPRGIQAQGHTIPGLYMPRGIQAQGYRSPGPYILAQSHPCPWSSKPMVIQAHVILA